MDSRGNAAHAHIGRVCQPAAARLPTRGSTRTEAPTPVPLVPLFHRWRPPCLASRQTRGEHATGDPALTVGQTHDITGHAQAHLLAGVPRLTAAIHVSPAAFAAPMPH